MCFGLGIIIYLFYFFLGGRWGLFFVVVVVVLVWFIVGYIFSFFVFCFFKIFFMIDRVRNEMFCFVFVQDVYHVKTHNRFLETRAEVGGVAFLTDSVRV